MAAEIELVGEHGDGASGHPDADINKATYLATLVEGILGFGETLVVERSPYDCNELSRLRVEKPAFVGARGPIAGIPDARDAKDHR